MGTDEFYWAVMEQQLMQDQKLGDKIFQINSFAKFINEKTNHLQLGVDFSFNTLRNVQRVDWKEESKTPWYREVSDGLSWIAYCKNKKCAIFKEMFIVSRGFGLFKMNSDIDKVVCPVCKKLEREVRNVGFVNCEWTMRIQLKKNSNSRFTSEGRTFDGKLYTF